jgi:hypothetical protein
MYATNYIIIIIIIIIIISKTIRPTNQTFFIRMKSYFWIRENFTLEKAHFVDPNEQVKPRLFQALTRDARPDSNSRPTM